MNPGRHCLNRRLNKHGVLGLNRRNLSFINRHNPRSRLPLVDDKCQTKQLAGEHGIPTPGLQHVIQTHHDIRHLNERLKAFPGFAAKPARGGGGRGILIVHRTETGAFADSAGNLLPLAMLQHHFSNTLAGLYSLSGTPDAVILEDLVEADDAIAPFSYEGIPDIRILVFRGYPVMAMLRLTTRASRGKANLHQGAIGVGIDLGNGSALQAIHNNSRITRHPDTGASLEDLQIPHWQQMLELAARCHDMTGLGYLGADLVLDRKRGPLLLELNARPGLSIQLACGQGLQPRLRIVDDHRGPPETPAARVQRSRALFSTSTVA